MTHEEFLGLPAAWTDHDVRFLPKPNRCDVILTSDLAPAELTKTTFVLPFLENGDIVLANVRKPGRGLEVPGGHIEPGEDAYAGALREGLEEAGCHFEELFPIGFVRMASKGSPPPGWQYPHPLSFQQFFAGRVARLDDYVENEECGTPAVLTPDEVQDRLNGAQRAFHAQATALLFGSPLPRS